MRKNKQRFQAVKFQQEILKRQCHVIQNFLFLIFFCQTSLELKTFFFKNPSKSRFWLFDSSPYKIFLDFDFFKRTLGIQDIRDPGQQGSGSRTIGIRIQDIRIQDNKDPDPGQQGPLSRIFIIFLAIFKNNKMVICHLNTRK